MAEFGYGQALDDIHLAVAGKMITEDQSAIEWFD
jgi:hypothetical protein